MKTVIEKYFKDHTLYFQSSDALSRIEGDTYLRYELRGNCNLYFGGNSGEVCILCTDKPEKLEEVIRAIIY